MIQNLDKYLSGIALGVRFRANFSIEDQLGQIIDKILYSKGSFFNPSVFPYASSEIGRRILSNEETNDRIRIDNSNIILEIQLDEKFKVNDLPEILKHFESDIIKDIMKIFAIKEIVRIGYIRRYIFPMKDLAKTFVNKTIGRTLEGVNDINLRFSQKTPIQEALIKEDVNDYNNTIFNIIKKADLDEIYMSIDFQTCFDPFLPTSKDIEFKTFIKNAESFNRDKYLPWLNSNYVEENDG